MLIKTKRDAGQRYRPRQDCIKKMEPFVIEMQDPKTGLKGTEQKLNVTTIPHVINGRDIVDWIMAKMKTNRLEAEQFVTMLIAFGYIYPLQNHKKLVLDPDALYRFQTPYFWPKLEWPADDTDYAIYLAKRNMRKKGELEPYEQDRYNNFFNWMNHKWDFIVLQATEQFKAGRERPKADRVVFECQERAYWIVHRPPPRTNSGIDYGLERHIDHDTNEHVTYDYYRRMIMYLQQSIMTGKFKSTVSLGALFKFVTNHIPHDPFLVPPLPSNPWQTDNDAYWELNLRTVETPTKMRVERWALSFWELLSDPRGRADFKVFLKKEFSGENMAFWEAADNMKYGAASAMKENAQNTFKLHLAPGAPRWINIDGRTMGATVKGLQHPHRYVLEGAQTHIFMLMKKDTFYRYLKSPVYKDMQKRALNPIPHNFTDAQLEANVRTRKESISPIILHAQEEEEKAKAAAAAAPVDLKKIMSKLDKK